MAVAEEDPRCLSPQDPWIFLTLSGEEMPGKQGLVNNQCDVK